MRTQQEIDDAIETIKFAGEKFLIAGEIAESFRCASYSAALRWVAGDGSEVDKKFGELIELIKVGMSEGA